jgi:uncharacterized protein
MQYETLFCSIIRNEKWLMDLLDVVRDLDLPDWFIAAGAIRNTVWDVISNYEDRHIKDIDVVYYDLNNNTRKRDKKIEEKLQSIRPNYSWDVFNQTRAKEINHKRYLPTSSCDSMGYFSETPTCIGVRLEKNNSITVCAEYGLNNLMNMVVQPVPKPKQDLELYARRVASKGWQETWPLLEINNI